MSILYQTIDFFKGSVNVLQCKSSLLRQKGLGKKPNKTNSLTRQEEDILWECGQLGEKTPESIAGSSHSKFWVAGETRTSLNES